MKQALWLIAYISIIFAANWSITYWGMVPVGFGLEAPAAVYFAGFALTARDMLHEETGPRTVVVAIIVGALISAVLDPALGLASGVAFLLSEGADFAIYTPLRESGKVRALLASNAVGLVVDSVVFLWLAFGSLDFLAGQVVGKAWITLATVPLFWAFLILTGRR